MEDDCNLINSIKTALHKNGLLDCLLYINGPGVKVQELTSGDLGSKPTRAKMFHYKIISCMKILIGLNH